jgi:hypothetical protein
VSHRDRSPSHDDWQPATSRPGELYTIEGQIRTARAFARGLRNRDPRLKPYRRMMLRGFAVAVGLAAAVALVAALISALT